jgi:hypothetical protein
MAYTSEDWTSGEVITAAKINNLETQYSQIKATYFDKFSTASTGTSLMAVTSTSAYATLSSNFIHIAVPPGIQQSRFELSVTGQSLSTIPTATYVILVRGLMESTHRTVAAGLDYAGYVWSTWTTAAAGQVKTTGFSAMGGEWLTLYTYNPTSTTFNLWNIKISGTSTALEDNACSIFRWSASCVGIPTSTG